ncbi:hypothetical protein J1605_012625 [Eschrichtius robustus]|uniref:Receptor ligand binding region domain-containing protein n=1 Tax=Eschrichtius robustus TaxID=9764 RepID=A0AB34GK70_ESCRO|nr:hypothetical protein J1605_001250 [Eschrichtius robustus]KAJ8779422.1 hypothetical protein J1605_012625 [Eschrichtius robustus]
MWTAREAESLVCFMAREDGMAEWLWKNYQYILVFLFAIEEINKDSHLLPNLSLSFNLYNAFPSDQRTLESALFWLSGGNQTLPNYNCQGQRKSVAIVTGTALAFSAEIGTVLKLYRSPQVTYGPFDPLLSDKDQFPSLYQMATTDSSLAQGMIWLLLHFGWTWVALFVSDDLKGEQFLWYLKAEMCRGHNRSYMGNLHCKCRTWCHRCQPRHGAPVGCHPLVLPSWEAATSDRNHPAAPTPAFCPSRRLSHRDRVPLLPGFHIALKMQYPIQQARYSRLEMLPLVSWRDSPKKPVLSAHSSIMVGHLRAIKSPPLGHKFTLLHSPAEQVVKVRKPIPSSHLPLPSPKEREVKVPSHAMVSSAPTACCSLLLERPTKEVLGEDHRPKSPGSLMSGKELQREKASHIPSRSSSSLLSTSSRHCKQKIPLPLFLPLPGLRSPPSGIEALTWDRAHDFYGNPFHQHGHGIWKFDLQPTVHPDVYMDTTAPSQAVIFRSPPGFRVEQRHPAGVPVSITPPVPMVPCATPIFNHPFGPQTNPQPIFGTSDGQQRASLPGAPVFSSRPFTASAPVFPSPPFMASGPVFPSPPFTASAPVFPRPPFTASAIISASAGSTSDTEPMDTTPPSQAVIFQSAPVSRQSQ